MKNSAIIFSYLATLKKSIIVYLLCTLSVALTIYLYELPLSLFLDTLLFSLVIIIIFGVYGFLSYRKTYKLYENMDQQVQNLSNEQINKLITPKTDLDRMIIKLLQDILTEKKRLVLEQEVAYDELLNYYSLWSHQIKTPLSVLSLLAQTNNPNPKDISRELFKVDEYLRMMLHYLKMPTISQDLTFKKHSLEKMIHDSLKKYATFFIQKDLSLDLSISDTKITTDEKWFEFIFEQILFNALKYTTSGTITIYNTQNSLVISDTGIGILSQDLPRIFERGYTGFNGNVDKKATGLGLHMSQQIASHLGIVISIESVIDQGTTVTIIFPTKEYIPQ